MPATAPWLAAAESLLNRGIEGSGRAAALAARLDGRSLQVEVDAVMRIRAVLHHGRLSLLAGEDAHTDALIQGSPAALWQMLNAGRGGARPATGGGVQIRGDAEIANLFRELLGAARPDLEEELSRHIGELPARGLARFARSVGSWAQRARRTAGENVAEYLQEEGRDLVNRTEAEEFLQGVDQVRESADRVDARLARLEQRLKGRA
jgi:ubiquinone biosynthesis accessory factor UbiJ